MAVEKVTVSLPAELLARIEDRRRSAGISRSEVVSELLWRGWQQVETEEREERYRSAYQARPETDEERAWADDAAAELFDGETDEPLTVEASPPRSRTEAVTRDSGTSPVEATRAAR